MSIHSLREDGFAGMTMRYEDGGRIQVFTLGNGKELRLPGSATVDDVKEAFRKAEREADAITPDR